MIYEGKFTNTVSEKGMIQDRKANSIYSGSVLRYLIIGITKSISKEQSQVVLDLALRIIYNQSEILENFPELLYII